MRENKKGEEGDFLGFSVLNSTLHLHLLTVSEDAGI
jgi:hypothetical protein